MKFKVAVVEDDFAARQALVKTIERYADEKGYEISVSAFSDGFSFLQNYGSDAEVLFLDIEMAGLSGMDVARRVRKSDPDVILVFVTHMGQFAVEGYEVRAFDFILKPVSYHSFVMRLDRICNELRHRLDDFHILLKNRAETRRVRVLDILYVEVRNHELIFYFRDGGEMRVRGTIAETEKQLAPHHFARCNSCYLVNLKYVGKLAGYRLVIGGRELSISQSRRQSFLSEFAKYAGGSK